jgi:hypothetical protein
MNLSTSIASFLTVVLVVSLVIFRLLWAGSTVAALAGLGRIPKLPESWCRWFFDERNGLSN